MIVFFFPHEGKKPGKNFIGGSTLTLSLKGEGTNGFVVQASCNPIIHGLTGQSRLRRDPTQKKFIRKEHG